MKKIVLSAVIGAMPFVANAQDKAPSVEEMWQLIQAQQAEISKLKQQLNTTSVKVESLDVKVEATAEAVDSGAAFADNSLAAWAQKTSLGGYAEHHFNHFEDGDDQIDAHRYVLYIAHQFSDDIRFFSEFELEHGVTGEGEPGEVELEQAYIQWDFHKNHSVQFGQFLIPVGLINETHEPDTFYGTERNRVESEVLPATWWETGIQLIGEVAPGLTYNAAIHSGLEVPVDGGSAFRIRSGRQKSAEANAEDLAFTGRLKYTGVPGLEVATSFQYQQEITQGAAADDAGAFLTTAHVAYQSEGFGFRALWAGWDIDGDDFEDADADSLEGWYIEPSYKINSKLGFFVRYSEWDRGNRTDRDFEAYDYGLNYWLYPTVVLKADYTDSVGEGDEADAFNLGVGWSF